MPSRVWNTLSYPVRRHLLRNRTLTARSRYGPRFRFWVEDAGGRAIYKRGTYVKQVVVPYMYASP